MKCFLLGVVFTLAACGGIAPASPSEQASAAATAQASTPSAATSSPIESQSDQGAVLALRIVDRLDELLVAVASGDGDLTGLWANEEGQWVSENLPALVADPALADYVTNTVALLQAVADGADQTEAIASLVAMRNEIAVAFGLPLEAVTTPAPTPVATPAKATTFTKIARRTWARIVKSPDRYTGKGYRLWACITQFDAATGPDSFRAQASYRKEPYWFSDGVNTFFSGSAAKLEPFVEDDVVEVRAIGAGSYTYDTQNGGNTTAPIFQVWGIKRVGSC